jgi:hypothetical protein
MERSSPLKDKSDVVETSFLSNLSFDEETDHGSSLAGYFEEYLKAQMQRNDYDYAAEELASTSTNSSRSSLDLPQESAIQMYGSSMWTRSPAMTSGESSSGASISSIPVSALSSLPMIHAGY